MTHDPLTRARTHKPSRHSARYAAYKRAKREAVAGSLLGHDKHALHALHVLQGQDWADSLGFAEAVSGGGWGYRERFDPQPLPYGWTWTLTVEYGGDAYDPGDPLTIAEAYETLRNVRRADRLNTARAVVAHWADREQGWMERGAVGLVVTIHGPDGAERAEEACYGFADSDDLATHHWAVEDLLGEALHAAQREDTQLTIDYYEDTATYAAGGDNLAHA